ncbi:hypothetical protein [Chitinophaga ginsengisoli]|uniref:Lipoprotein n=1 Tax=Chitinophaga ginsengisoli TaxID=363837 RepID=A0A2P8GGG6_9BACT|nr:hypothetical protein [Chitinophaga ginsengisoli]PSL33025.1 hypothetical protein CLV42_1037 [Chitinophaga ginsengisoli]
MKKYVTIILCIAALISCKKDDSTHVMQEGTYTNKNLATAGPITLYVGDKTITEPTFIHDFLERRINNWLMDSTFREQPGINTPFIFTEVTIEGDMAYYTQDPGNSYQDTFHINPLSTNTRLLVANRESIIKPTVIGELSCANVAKYVRRNPPTYACSYFNYPDSYCTGHKQLQLNVESDHLVIPVLTYYFARPIASGVVCHTYERYISDDFNKDILGKLRPEDTLAVQTYFVKLYK